MDSPFTLLSFLMRSENRMTVLETLADGPAARTTLQAETGIPRATLSRILAEFRDRRIARRVDDRFQLTPFGAHVAAELSGVFDSIESMWALQTVAEWLPLDRLDISLEELDDVAVTLPTPIDPMAPVKAAAAAIDDVEHVRGFCYSVVHAPILAECRNVTERGHRFEGVIASGVLDVIAADPGLADRLRSLISDAGADLYVLEGSIEPQLIIADRTTMFLVTDDEGAIRGLVSIADGSILPWAEETFATMKRAAEPLDPDRAVERLAP